MSREAALQPFALKGLELRNRIVRTAHGTNLGQGTLNDALIAFHEERARGGVALTVLEATGVHPSGPITLNAWDDAIVPRYEELARRMHAHGTRVFSQLNHLGLAAAATRTPPWSASALVGPLTSLRALAVSPEQIHLLVQAFADAARRARAGGLDGVEVHCAHGHLLQQFLSPLTNRRADAYGGSLAGRRRFVLEVLRACRAAVGDDYVLGIRVGPQELPGGIGVDEHVDLVRWLEAEKLVDYVSISHGSAHNAHKIIGAMHEPPGYELAASAPVAAATSLPTMVTGRLRSVAEASEVIERGIADLVGLTRAHIADPQLVAKTMAGRTQEVRPCIGCNQGCVGGLARGRIGCTVNPRAGRELEFDPPALSRSPRRAAVSDPVIVIGGGPAGLEAARTAREIGRDVILIEAGDRLGGTLCAARLAPHHATIGDIGDWLEREVRRLGVEVRLATRGDESFAQAHAGHDVVISTGGRPVTTLEQRHWPQLPTTPVGQPVLTPRELLEGGIPDGVRHVLVLDETGTYEAIGAAELLVSQGIGVAFVTGHASFAPRLESALVSGPALERLRGDSFQLYTRAALLEVHDRRARLRWIDGGDAWEVPADCIVAAQPAATDDALADAFRAANCRVITVGNARQYGTLQDAIRDGHDAALRLADNPTH